MLQIIISKWVGGLLLPPALLALCLLLLWWLLPRWRPARHGVAAVAVLLFLLATPWAGSRLLGLMEQEPALRLPLRPLAPAAIVVLGGGVADYSPEWQGPVLGQLSLQRVHYAAWLQQQTGLPLLVSGGRVSSHVAEADVMAQVLRRDFMRPVRWVENQSRNTQENARLSARVLRAAGIRQVYVVTQAWHMPRALEEFRREGLLATGAPVGFTPRSKIAALSFLPTGQGLWWSYLAAHEALGRLAQPWRGRP